MYFYLVSSIYCTQSEDKAATGVDGKRSSLNISIDRVNRESLLSAIPLSSKVICIDHCASRVAEKLIRLTLESIMDIFAREPSRAIELINNFSNNLMERDVHQASRIEVVNSTIKVMSCWCRTF